jgi:hypothetical protein
MREAVMLGLYLQSHELTSPSFWHFMDCFSTAANIPIYPLSRTENSVSETLLDVKMGLGWQYDSAETYWKPCPA